MIFPLRNLRLTLLECLVKMWRILERLNLTLPVPVKEKRFFAPLCVFIFGMGFFLVNSSEDDFELISYVQHTVSNELFGKC